MKILLDTHILIWALTHHPLLPEKAKEIIMDSDNEIYYSIVSLWEVEIKHLTNPKNLNVSSKIISAVAEVSGYTLIPLNPLSIYRLPELFRCQQQVLLQKIVTKILETLSCQKVLKLVL